MNCRPGDLALIVQGLRQNIGKMVRCVRLIEHGELVNTPRGFCRVADDIHPCWLIDRQILSNLTKLNVHIGTTLASVACDRTLIPIRPDQDLTREDEAMEAQAPRAPQAVRWSR